MHIDTAGRGGRRSLDAAVNLVPYLDMLMTVMAFLVVSAAWTSVAALGAHSSLSTGGAGTAAVEVMPTVHLGARDVSVSYGDARATFDTIGPALAHLRNLAGNARDLDVMVDDGVAVERVTAAMDAARAHRFDNHHLRAAR